MSPLLRTHIYHVAEGNMLFLPICIKNVQVSYRPNFWNWKKIFTLYTRLNISYALPPPHQLNTIWRIWISYVFIHIHVYNNCIFCTEELTVNMMSFITLRQRTVNLLDLEKRTNYSLKNSYAVCFLFSDV